MFLSTTALQGAAPALVPIAIETAVTSLHETSDDDVNDLELAELAETKHADQMYEKYVDNEEGMLSKRRVALFARSLVRDI